jgi:hypothetical protein
MSDWRGLYFNDMHSPVGANKAIFTDEDGNRERCFSGAWCWACDQEHIRVLTARAEAAEAEVEELRRRIEAALAYCDELKPIAFGWKIARILRGESGE